MLSHAPGAALAASLALASFPTLADAQTTPPPPTQHSEHVAEAAPSTDETIWTVQAGGILNTGNTRSLSLSGGSRLSLKRARNVFAAAITATYGTASLRDPTTNEFGDYVNSSENVTGSARYDRFLSEMDALFVSVGALHDPFAGLDIRMQGQAGYLRNFFKYSEGKHRFWGEVGYDLTYDNFEPDPLLDADGNRLDGSQVIHSGRLFVGYDNHVNENVTFLTGVEALLDVQDVDNLRLNSVSELRSKISGKLQLGLQFSLRFDNVPVEGTEKLDTTTTLNLLYSLL
jgi:putative salt-induced outer membrane protein YdiY